GLRGGGLLVAAVLGDPARDGAGDRLEVLVVGAVVHAEPVAPGRALGLADQGHAAAVVARRDRGQDLVARGAEPVQRIPAPERLLAVRIRAHDLGAYLQAVARAAHVVHAGQFADRGVEQVEGLAGFQRDLDLALVAIGEGFAVHPP